MEVCLQGRDWDVLLAQRPRLADPVRARRLVPRAEHPGRGRGRLAAGDRGQPLERVRRLRPGHEAELQRGRLGLQAPGVGVGAAEPEVAGLGVVHQHPVAGRREQPGHREVGGVVAVPESLRRHEDLHDRPVIRLVGAVGDEVLDLVAPLVHRVRALAEAQVALPRPRLEPHPDRGHARGVAGHRRIQVDQAIAARGQPNVDSPGGIGRLEVGLERAANLPTRGHAGGVEPPGRRPETQGSARPDPQSGVLAQHGGARGVGEGHPPGIGRHAGPQRARGNLC